HESDRRELTGPKDGNDADERLLQLDDDVEEEDNDEPLRSRQRLEQQRNGDGLGGASLSTFPHDEPLLQALWAFLVSCAEANSNNNNNNNKSSGGGSMESGRGAELLRQQRCHCVVVPPALATLMIAFSRRSMYGTLTA
ncbi:ATP-dependent RNA helicase, partial [Trypanosoma grayi]|uniref:ATP-dependent RNA helicase n=1 Tax=Trypanosoma grayi TaxID=71804 RepID=UPI0004F4794F